MDFLNRVNPLIVGILAAVFIMFIATYVFVLTNYYFIFCSGIVGGYAASWNAKSNKLVFASLTGLIIVILMCSVWAYFGYFNEHQNLSLLYWPILYLPACFIGGVIHVKSHNKIFNSKKQ